MSTALTSDDRAAIADLVHAYCRRLDAGDLDGVAALFAEATFASTRTTLVREGSNEVRAMYDPVVLYDDGTPRTQHCISNLVVRAEPDGASSSCTFVVLQQVGGQPIETVLAGEYRDHFVRGVDGAWRFAARLVHPHLMGDLSRHMRRQ